MNDRLCTNIWYSFKYVYRFFFGAVTVICGLTINAVIGNPFEIYYLNGQLSLNNPYLEGQFPFKESCLEANTYPCEVRCRNIGSAGHSVSFVAKRFLHESARREASWPETQTIRLRNALRIFFDLGKTPEMICQGCRSHGRSGSGNSARRSGSVRFGSIWNRKAICAVTAIGREYIK